MIDFRPGWFALMLAILSCVAANYAAAAAYQGIGTVHTLNADDLSVFGANTNWFELNGVVSLGNCRAWNGTVFRLKDDQHGQQMYAMIMAAFISGTSITVYADDTYVDSNGYCYAQQVVLGQFPP